MLAPELVDAYGDLAEARKQFAPTEALYQKYRKQVMEGLAALPAEAGTVCAGKKWVLDISARKIERTVDVAKARKRLGAAMFLRVCSVTMKALEAFLLKPEIEALLISERTGAREIVVTAAEPGS